MYIARQSNRKCVCPLQTDSNIQHQIQIIFLFHLLNFHNRFNCLVSYSLLISFIIQVVICCFHFSIFLIVDSPTVWTAIQTLDPNFGFNFPNCDPDYESGPVLDSDPSVMLSWRPPSGSNGGPIRVQSIDGHSASDTGSLQWDGESDFTLENMLARIQWRPR